MSLRLLGLAFVVGLILLASAFVRAGHGEEPLLDELQRDPWGERNLEGIEDQMRRSYEFEGIERYSAERSFFLVTKVDPTLLGAESVGRPRITYQVVQLEEGMTWQPQTPRRLVRLTHTVYAVCNEYLETLGEDGIRSLLPADGEEEAEPRRAPRMQPRHAERSAPGDEGNNDAEDADEADADEADADEEADDVRVLTAVQRFPYTRRVERPTHVETVTYRIRIDNDNGNDNGSTLHLDPIRVVETNADGEVVEERNLRNRRGDNEPRNETDDRE